MDAGLIQTVVQQHESGCGLACVAMLSGRSYAAVRQRAAQLGIVAEDERLWSQTDYVRCLLADCGVAIAAEEQPFVSWDHLPDLALLAIKYRRIEGRPFWHWVVFCRRHGQPLVLDPAAYLDCNERRDFDAMAPQWFIPVVPIRAVSAAPAAPGR